MYVASRAFLNKLRLAGTIFHHMRPAEHYFPAYPAHARIWFETPGVVWRGPKSGVGKVRPVGQIRLSEASYPARGVVFEQLVDKFDERM